jgi:hypothetical protein
MEMDSGSFHPLSIFRNFDSLEKENFDSLKRKILTVGKGKF